MKLQMVIFILVSVLLGCISKEEAEKRRAEEAQKDQQLVQQAQQNELQTAQQRAAKRMSDSLHAVKRYKDSIETAKEKAVIDFFKTQAPIDSIPYRAEFTVDPKDKKMMTLYSLWMMHSRSEEVNMAHLMPGGTNIADNTTTLLALILTKQFAIDKQFSALIGDRSGKQYPGAEVLFEFKKDDPDAIRLLNMFDANFSLEEKVWLHETGGNQVSPGVNQMLFKVLVKQLSLQKKLNSIEKNLNGKRKGRKLYF